MKKVIVGSRNPVKLNAVKGAFEKMFINETFVIEGISVSSDVEDQPMDDSTTFKGAENRANNAMAQIPLADYWVGIEGGTEKTGKSEMQAFAWIVIKSRKYTGKGRTGTFFLPNEVVNLINEGKELGEADDIVFGQNNSKQKSGAVGLLTGNAISRTDLYSQGVVLALIPFKQKKHYSASENTVKD